MSKCVTVDFSKVISELENKKLNICFVKFGDPLHPQTRFCIEDFKNNVYDMETYYSGSYLEKLINCKAVVNFYLIENFNIKENQKERWSICQLNDFIKMIGE